MKNIMRIFPRRTNATPVDDMVRVGVEPGLFDECAEAHISVAYTYDIPFAERLYKAWSRYYPTKIGGPAVGERGGEFMVGMYVREGYTITSRGCPNRCWFCSVWRREGNKVRELNVRDGWNVLDDNLLACNETHIREVFAMLKRQTHRPEFTGGLEAKRIKRWHIEEMVNLKTRQMFFAYDTGDDLEPLINAGRLVNEAGFTLENRKARCYVLCGWDKNEFVPADTFDNAELRMRQTIAAGFFPMAMLYRDDKTGKRDDAWKKWARTWARPEIIATKINEMKAGKQ